MQSSMGQKSLIRSEHDKDKLCTLLVTGENPFLLQLPETPTFLHIFLRSVSHISPLQTSCCLLSFASPFQLQVLLMILGSPKLWGFSFYVDLPGFLTSIPPSGLISLWNMICLYPDITGFGMWALRRKDHSSEHTALCGAQGRLHLPTILRVITQLMIRLTLAFMYLSGKQDQPQLGNMLLSRNSHN